MYKRGIRDEIMNYETIQVKKRDNVCFVKFISADGKNCINNTVIFELTKVFQELQESCNVIVIEGNEQYFCYGADFKQIGGNVVNGGDTTNNPAPLFDLWKMMIEAPCVVISHVLGEVNAGGMGFISACDIVIASNHAVFSLSELLFGLMPAMVLPFLIRRIGFSKANYLTLTTKSITCEQAYNWGLVDIQSERSEVVLRQLIARLSKTPKDGIERYKNYANKLYRIKDDMREKAIEANLQVFSDEVNLKRIVDFSILGKYPWEDKDE